MSTFPALHEFLARSAQEFPQRTAVEEADGGAISYHDLAALSGRLQQWLASLGVGRNDRVGIYLRKSIDSVAAIFGILRSGAAYVPVDATAPSSRNAYILYNASAKAIIVEGRFVDGLQSELAALGAAPSLLILDDVGGGAALVAALEKTASTALNVTDVTTHPDDLAYLLYTSGSTGTPKGVMLSHRNATCFVDWCSDLFQPNPDDRFSSHAPFHFDLSILDLYVPIKHGAAVVLFGESLGKEPLGLAQKIAERRITIWYSAPSILSMLAQQGRLDRHDYAALRMVFFAGEVFPLKHWRALHALWPHPRYFNLYGPTETNVCTSYEVPAEVPSDQIEPFPIGHVCAHYRARVIDPDGQDVASGSEGELCIAGPGVMQGYWGLPEQNARVFLDDSDGVRWYRTGDVVQQQSDGAFRFLGRRDRMIKKRGYRVELGEIEAALYRHPDVKEAAVIALSDEEKGVQVRAFLSTKDGGRLSLIELKRFCAERLPLYMVPDGFSFLGGLPKTSTDKIDYQKLKELP
jgi:amino acid adenylation domain-containing protein